MPTKKRNRPLDQVRPVEIAPGFHRLSEGSVLYRAEGTVVMITASVSEEVPKWMSGKGTGWVTAEYQMHPRSNPEKRERRDGRDRPLSGRSREIQRLIGRSLRAAVDPKQLGERMVEIDCDVIEADGGTRTASVTGGWIALALALARLRETRVLERPVLRDQIAAVSVGHVDGQLALDLNYAEDSTARVDLNVVATARGGIVEIQGTAEGEAVPRSDLDSMIDLALSGIDQLAEQQRAVLERAGVDLGKILLQP